MMRKLRYDDTGAVAVLFALMAFAIIAISALAVDVGYWYTCKRQLQSAADAAALAGATELGHDGTAVQIQGEVNTFAQRNFTNPLPIGNARVASTEIGADYVKVTTEADAGVFLARWILNRGTTLVRAQAVAELGWLAGGRAPVPWGLSILRIGDLSGELGGYTASFTEQSDGYWEGTFAGGTGPLTFDAVNAQGYHDIFSGLVSVGTIPATGKIASVDVDQTTFTSGVDNAAWVSVTLRTPLATGAANKYKVEAEIGTSKVSLTPDAARLNFQGAVPIGTTGDPYLVRPLTVTVYEDGKAVPSAVSCGLLLRRANFLVQDLQVDPIFPAPGEAVSVAVKTLDFTYGAAYQLKVEGGTGSTGNFQALDFDSLDHSTCGFPVINDPGHSGGSDYRDNIVGNTSIVAHLGDFVTTKPGDMIGPTKQGVTDRLAGISPLLSLEQWEAAGRPETKQLCIIPICERIEDQNGRAVLRVVSFATFFLESKVVGNDTVNGRFIEWTAPGWFVVGGNPPNNLATQAAHLVNNRLDF